MSTTTEKWTIFGERLKTELERQEMSLRQFAEKAGLTLTTACRYVHSQRTPRATEILKAAKVLGVTCDYMLGLSDDPHKTRDGWAKAGFHELPSAQPDSKELSFTHKALDTISRQAAIRWVKTECNPYGKPTLDFESGKKVIEHLKQMPSAQPEKRTDKCTKTHACDCISRQAAIDAMDLGRWKGMTNEEAIKTLEANYPDACFEQLREAVDAAIEALKAQDADSDTISRKAAIDALVKAIREDPYYDSNEAINGLGVCDVRVILNDLPSVQPETHEERTETHACDLISRQAAIDAHYEYCNKHPDAGFPVWSLKILENLPSAQPDMSEYSDKLWKAAYERGKAKEQQRWIPCSERLPEEGQEILATTTDNAWGDVVIIRTYYKEMHKSVIAWMPLPKPYRAERRTDEGD